MPAIPRKGANLGARSEGTDVSDMFAVCMAEDEMTDDDTWVVSITRVGESDEILSS